MDFIKLAFVGICINLKTDLSTSVLFCNPYKTLYGAWIVGTEPRQGASLTNNFDYDILKR